MTRSTETTRSIVCATCCCKVNVVKQDRDRYVKVNLDGSPHDCEVEIVPAGEGLSS